MDIAVTVFWVVVAVAFYRVRCRSRLLYGALEVAAGIGVIIIGEFPPNAIAAATTWTLGSRAAHMLALMGGVYIVVRGLDNIEQALPGRWRPAWRRIFGDARAGRFYIGVERASHPAQYRRGREGRCRTQQRSSGTPLPGGCGAWPTSSAPTLCCCGAAVI
jgi:hypothetical protein